MVVDFGLARHFLLRLESLAVEAEISLHGNGIGPVQFLIDGSHPSQTYRGILIEIFPLHGTFISVRVGDVGVQDSAFFPEVESFRKCDLIRGRVHVGGNAERRKTGLVFYYNGAGGKIAVFG